MTNEQLNERYLASMAMLSGLSLSLITRILEARPYHTTIRQICHWQSIAIGLASRPQTPTTRH